MRFLLLLLLTCGLGILVMPQPGYSQTAEQRREISDLKREVTAIAGLVRKKQFAEAKAGYDAAEQKLTELAQALGVEPSDRKLLGIEALIEKGRESLEIAQARAEGREPRLGPSFAGEIAPLIQAECVNCHGGANPRANLDLSTFAGWKRGGRSGPLLVPGNPARSLLLAKLTLPDPQRRMPANRPPLSAENIRLIAKWVEAGARFDGESDTTPLADLRPPGSPQVEVVIPRPKGNETVSFTRDIAPFMANLCVRCHNSNRKSGGLSLETFYDMMKGGDSGPVVLPGNVEGSRLFRLTGGLENPRMPNDPQSRITRKNYEDLKKWFEEGNAFDGDDPRTPLRTYAMANTESAADRFARMSAEEFNSFRIERTESQWKRAVPGESFNTYQTDEFYLIGNVSPQRLQQVDQWAQDHLKTLKQTFSGGGGPAWKGRLAIFVFKDRFGYDEFNQVVNNRRAPREMIAHAVVTPTYEDAYVCLQDVGDEATHETGGLQVSLLEHLTAAYLQREGASLPDWLVRGTGLAMAQSVLRNNVYLRELETAAGQTVKTVLNPADVFADGTFSPAMTGAVGFALVKYMLNNGGGAKFGNFVKALRDGRSAAEAVRAVYNADLAALGRDFMRAVAR